MSKKPTLTTSKEKRLMEAKNELASEESTEKSVSKRQTTIKLDSDLLYAAQEVGLRRKRAGIEPHTLTGMVKEALTKIINKELNT